MKINRKKFIGFTLVEVMVTVSITAILLGAATTFYLEMARGNFVVNQRIAQMYDLRRLSQELVYHASRANQFYLYKTQTTTTDWDDPSDRLAIVTNADGSTTSPAGDFVVFIYYEIPKPSTQAYHRIQKLVGYYLTVNTGQIGTLTKVTIDLSQTLTGAASLGDQIPDYDTTTAKTMVEKVLVNNWANTGSSGHTKFETFILNVRGLIVSKTDTNPSTKDAGRLFYYRDSQNLVVAGQFFGIGDPDNKRTSTDTFNFAITPRS